MPRHIIGYLKDNQGIVSKNTGIATISSGSTLVNVTHGLASPLPAAVTGYKIQVTPIETLASASYWWVDTIGATTFRINVNANPTQDVDFRWTIETQ